MGRPSRPDTPPSAFPHTACDGHQPDGTGPDRTSSPPRWLPPESHRGLQGFVSSSMQLNTPRESPLRRSDSMMAAVSASVPFGAVQSPNCCPAASSGLRRWGAGPGRAAGPIDPTSGSSRRRLRSTRRRHVRRGVTRLRRKSGRKAFMRREVCATEKLPTWYKPRYQSANCSKYAYSRVTRLSSRETCEGALGCQETGRTTPTPSRRARGNSRFMVVPRSSSR